MNGDAALASLAADAYAPVPAGRCIDWQDVRAVVTGDVVALRGTRIDDLRDLLRDAETWPERSADHPALGRCHAGFLRGACGLLPLVAPLVGGRPVTVTGHSLGGGMALILAAMLPGVVECVTFEAPRAGGPMLAAALAGIRGRQYCYGDDPVPGVPWLPGVFEHVWPLISIGRALPDPLDCHSIARVLAWLGNEAAAA